MDNTLADRVKEVVDFLKDQRNMTVAQIATACDVTVQSVYQWVNGETKSIDGGNLAELSQLSGYECLWISKGRGNKIRAYAKTDAQQKILQVMEKMDTSAEYQLLKIGDLLAESGGGNHNSGKQ